MASAMTAGLQTNVAACAKHFAGNNVEDRRDNNNAQMADEQTLREIYGRHFEMVVRDGGVACVMAAYNSVNGVKSTQNAHLLNDILRDDFGFQGLVISDWWAMPGAQTAPSQATAQSNAAQALEAGMDLEVPWTLNYGQLDELVDSGRLTAAQINTSAARIIRQKARFKALYLDEDIGLRPTRTSMVQGSIVNNDPHIELSRQAAVKSMVLLKNANGVLPIQAGAGIDTVAVIGPQRTYTLQSTTGQPGSNCTTTGATTCTTNFVTELQFGDRGSSRVNPDLAKTIGPAAGMTQVGTAHGISIVTGNSAAAPGVAGADFIVVVVGLTPGDEGEEYAVPAGGDRASLTLPDGQDQFIRDAIALNKPMVVVIEAGGIVNMPWLNEVPAVVMAWYPGQQGGLALAQLLFGDENFTAKMPVAWPEESDLPPFKDSELTTQMGYFLGYRYLDQNDITPILPFGHGLSYSSYTYSDLQLGCPSADKNGVIPVTVNVQNNTATAGEETVFVFVSYPETTARRSVKELKGFRKVAFAANESKPVIIPIRVQDLKYWQGDANGQWVVESGPVEIMVGKSGADADLTLRERVNVL
jgi:beta-glucosidase